MNLLRRGLARDFWADAEAAVSSEHALLLVLIAVVIMSAVALFGQTVATNLFGVAVARLPF